jgi:lipopolysaccharide transport system permease protein
MTEHGSSFYVRMTAKRSWFDFGLREMFHYRELIRVLAARDLKLRYRQTVLGVAGVVIGPLLTAGVMTFIFGQVAGLSSEGVPYFAFSYAGFLGWNIFAGLVGRSSSVLVQNASLVTKTYVPRLALPLSGLFVVLVDFLIGSILMIAILVVSGIAPGLPLLLLPLWMLAIAGLALGIGSAFAVGMVYYRDVGLATSIVLQTVLYLTPVAYSSTEVPQRFHLLYTLNPVASLLEGFRWSILGTEAPSATRALVSVGLSAVALLAGCSIFARLERGLADVI